MEVESQDKFGGPTKPIKINEMDGLIKYLQTIDWTEPWFHALAIFHVTCALLTIWTRKTGVVQCAYFGVLMVLVLCAEYINEWAARNWNLFARQQYFDSNGLFISIVFSMPLLVNCLCIVVTWLWDVGVLISSVKEIKIQQKRNQKQKVDGKLGKSKDKQDQQEGEDKKEK